MSSIMPRVPRLLAAALLPVVALAACATTPRAAPANTTPPAADTAATPAAAPARRWSDADVQFMQHMIAHHAQALAMTALVPERTARTDLRTLAERIEATQRTEIAQMQRWLRERGQPVPDADPAHAQHGAGHAQMPGMLTAAEMARLAEARGPAFERLFLEYMIRHHEGALAMVATLFATSGAAQEAETYQVASDVDADQRAEIRRMRELLAAMPGGAGRR